MLFFGYLLSLLQEMLKMNSRIIRLFCLCLVVIISSCYNVSAAILDPLFGNDGRVAVELGVYGDRANAVVVQPDGKIVVGGSSSNASGLDFMLFRLLADGSLDPDFNFDGTVTSPVGSFDDEILALALQDDGKIIAAGYSSNGTDRDFALARYNSDGSLDRNFGLEGMVVTSVGNSDDEITGIALQADGSIVVTGSARGTAGRVIVLGRYLADGSLDTGFADDGFSFTGVGKEAQAESVALLDDQRIVVSGSYSDGEQTGLMIVGFRSDGQLDEGFGDNGIAIPSDSRTFSEGYGMFIRRDGTILVAGSVGEEGGRAAALFQFTAKGEPDADFEENGVLVTEIGAEDDVLYDVVEAGDIIAATGYTTVGNGREFLFITYEKSKVTVQKTSNEQDRSRENGGSSWLQISELQVESSFEEYQEDQGSGNLVVDVLTTEFGEGEDIATALEAMSSSDMVAVGISTLSDFSSAAVTKYTTASTLSSSTTSSYGSMYILTGEPYGVTRTTAIIPSQIFSGIIAIGEVTQRGVVFSTMPDPFLKDYGSSDNGGGDDTTPPTITNTTPASFKTDETVILSIATNEDATCKYNKDSDVAYPSMTNDFSGANSTSHSTDIGVLTSSSYTYYARCVDMAGNESSAGTAITFTVESTTSAVINRTIQTVGDLFVPSAIAAEGFDASKKDFIEEGSTKDGSGIGAFSTKLENLKPGTFFYARTYAVIGNKVFYGNEVGFRTGDSCFVATAAFGSIFHPYVQVLRKFRDSYMLNNYPGRSLVTLYYRYSPPVADVIAADSRLRFITRMLLLPVVGAAWLAIQPGMKDLLLLAAFACFCWYAMRPWITCRRV